MADIDFCEYLTGLPPVFYDLLVAFETTGDWVQFYVDDTVEVDWGSGHYLTYKEGIVYGRQTDAYKDKPVIVRSPDEFSIKTLRFGSGANWDNIYLSINILKASDLVNAEKLCYRLESMHTFTFFGNNQILNFKSAWEDCTELLEFNGMDTTRAITFEKAWKNANKLVTFPNIYAAECLSAEAAWMGCTSMVEFPIIDVSKCINFKNAWRGNVALKYFPYMDVGAGENFDHAWAYTTALDYFPALDFTSALNMNYAFAYMKMVNSFPFVDSPKATTFDSTFRKMLNLECIAGVDTNGISSRDSTPNMFYLTDDLVAPTLVEQSRIRDGWRYTNDNPCYYNAGRSVFFAHCETNGIESSFTVNGGDFEVDWGDGLFLPYNEGTVSDIPIAVNAINIRSEEDITRIEFNTDTFETIEIKRGGTLTDVDGMCSDLETLEYFEILGITQATDFTDICLRASNLVEVGPLDMDNVLTLTRAFEGCSSLTIIGTRYYDKELDETIVIDLEMPLATNFDSMFDGCSSIEHLQKCVTTSGQVFTQMFANMTSLECLDGVDTRNQTDTTNMFLNTPSLARPSVNEQNNILSGTLYDNLGNCGGSIQISFLTDREVTFMFDGIVFVDWGNGTFIEYPANTSIVGTQSGGTAYILGEATALVFNSIGITEIEFVEFDTLVSMKSMFEGMTTLTKFTFSGDSKVTDYRNAFKDSGIVTYLGPVSYVGAKDFGYMFSGTTSLDTVNAMYTVSGINFEYMFENSGLNCLQEIYTCVAQFPPNYVQCEALPIPCNGIVSKQCDDALQCDDIFLEPNEIPCDSTLACDIIWRCAEPNETILPIFGNSTMFDGCTPQSPDSVDRDKIMSRYYYIGVSPC